MATQPRLVNKQFNSPIGLYSQQNIQEVLDRESQILANGAVGINFHNPDVGKPANLKNSAVLRMLEEEENRQRNGIGPGAKRVAWPPPSETGSDSPYLEQNAVSAQGGPQYSPQSPGLQQNNYQAPAPQRSVSSNIPTNRPLKPLDVSTGSSSPLSSPLLNQSPLGFRSSTPAKGWAPVHSPVATPGPPSWQQPSSNQYQQQTSSSVVQQQQQRQPSSNQYQHQISSSSSVSQQQQPSSNQYQRQISSSSSVGQQSSSTTTRYQTAHQSVSQQTYLGQQYFPSSETQYQTSQQYQVQQQYQPSQQQYQSSQQQKSQSVQQQQYQSAQQQYQSPQQQYQSNQPPQQQYQSPQQQYQPPQQQYQAPQQQYQASQQYQAPQQQYQSPQQQYQSPQQQYQPPNQQYQPPQQQYQPSQQQYQSPQQQVPAQQQNQAFQSSQSAPLQAAAPSQVAPRAAPASKPAQPPPPSTITLRPNAPVSQAPPPVVTSQPATATLRVSKKNLRGDLKWPPEDVRRKIAEENLDSNDSFLSIQGGKHLRGDLKWPPECVRQQFAEENRLRLELAKGPACRPKRPNKDYTEFFEQHALNSSYPGYKIPPGTQFFRPL